MILKNITPLSDLILTEGLIISNLFLHTNLNA